MTASAKIKIECDDPLLNAVIASAIADGLERADFNNVQIRTLMVYMAMQPPAGSPLNNFMKKNIINEVIGEPVMEQRDGWRPPMVVTELCPSWVLGHPYMLDHLRETKPELLGSPVLIDTGADAPDYTKQLSAFMTGEVKAQPRSQQQRLYADD